jgi:hypothetical protein
MAQELKPTSCSLQDSSADSFSEKVRRISRRRRRRRREREQWVDGSEMNREIA